MVRAPAGSGPARTPGAAGHGCSLGRVTPHRFRFAPSPTGYLHIGSARTALFNWLAARHDGAEFVLRIEDTDSERSKPELIALIFRTLEWLGIDWDGEPVFQVQQAEAHRVACDRLLAEGRAYWCDCTPEQVKTRAEERGGKPGYDGHCRDRALGPGTGHVVRFRTPREGVTSFADVIRGDVEFHNVDLEDFVIVRSNGEPLFLVANTVDDLEMGITHVVRGEDLLNATPKTVLLRQALGHPEPPVFAHLPLIVNEKRQKLSKRRDDVAVEDYVERGYLPEAMANYLATLGWGAPDNVEIRPMADIVSLFRLEDVTKSSAFFDVKKLDHFNGEYVRALAVPDFIERAQPWLHRTFGEGQGGHELEAMAPLVQERVVRLDEVPGYIDFLVHQAVVIDEASWAKHVERFEPAAALLDDAVQAYATCDWTSAALHETTGKIAEAHGTKLGKATGPIRVAVTGRGIGPPLFESLEVLGRERTLERLRAARARI
jgi:glutamyl-tRNA synthetase